MKHYKTDQLMQVDHVIEEIHVFNQIRARHRIKPTLAPTLARDERSDPLIRKGYEGSVRHYAAVRGVLAIVRLSIYNLQPKK